jgi:hypothetical protein
LRIAINQRQQPHDNMQLSRGDRLDLRLGRLLPIAGVMPAGAWSERCRRRHPIVRSPARSHPLLSSVCLPNCSTNRLPRSAASAGVRNDHSAPRARIATQRVSFPMTRCSTS